MKATFSLLGLLCGLLTVSSLPAEENSLSGKALCYPDIIDIHYTPQGNGWGETLFTDEGSWMAFTLPEEKKYINGFCGPLDIDNKKWVAVSLVEAGYVPKGGTGMPAFRYGKAVYYPGHLFLKSGNGQVEMEQELRFKNKNNALLTCSSDKDIQWTFSGGLKDSLNRIEQKGDQLVIVLPRGECVALTFEKGCKVVLSGVDSYTATAPAASRKQTVVISFFNNREELEKGLANSLELPAKRDSLIEEHTRRWDAYIVRILRKGMPEKYDRAAVKALVTLLSNWRCSKGDLHFDGMVPSHANISFRGFWAWDTWQQAVATARFHPWLAQSQIRSMFDYQDKEGMIADCVFSNSKDNNYRDTKPPLAAWAVLETYRQSLDKDFLTEMYPKLLKYHQWWYKFRDHDRNGICEFGSTDGTEEAARWESGMDNAVRFDQVKMLKNGDRAWSLDQESVDLNAYLALEYRILREIAGMLCQDFQEPDRTSDVASYFFDKDHGYFFDKKLQGGFVKVEGPEGWTPIWTEVATPEQVKAALRIISNPEKFSTYIPFPTLAADHPQFSNDGYWRGPIWLNQIYFGVSGLRKYGYKKEADQYTDQVFTRLKGLAEGAPIHENYATRTGERLRAPSFSWSAADILFLYWEYGK